MNVLDFSNRHSVLARMGPAWLVMIADVDVASIITGLETGSLYGYHVIFIMLVLAVPLAIMQYASGRLGAVTGKGIGDVLRERYSRRVSGIASVPMAVTDILSYIAEYAGIAIGFALIGISPIISIPVVYVIHNAIVFSRRYDGIEKILIPISLVLVISIISTVFIFRPSFSRVLIGLSPVQPYGNSGFDYYIVANIGAVIMPFMLFYQAGATAEKRLGLSDLRLIRNETYMGAVVSELLMVGIVIAGTFIGGEMGVGALASAMKPFGPLAPYILAVGFISSGFLALVVISLGSSWGVGETLSWGNHDSGITSSSRKFFYLYVGESLPAMVIAIYLGSDLLGLVINLMVIFVIVLIPIGVLLGKLVSDEAVMGDHAFSRPYMALYWTTFAIIEAAGIWGIALSI
ncbi:MAG: divalent metal cation transporter [Candidatus Thermoplasmatota archaeon]|nr:divalent metal cation transporter [Candidatus Thermoplasmatota archaeon]